MTAAALLSAVHALDRQTLAGYLATRRWFGAKGRAIAELAVREVAPVPGEAAALTRVTVRFSDGAESEYQVPFALGGDANGPLGGLIDAAERPEFRRALGRAFARGAAVAGPTSRWEFEPLADLADLGERPTKVLGGEQSNTSIVFGERAIVKLFRRLEVGPNPDVEIGRFLAGTGFRGAPALLGVIHLRAPDGEAVAGMAQEYMPGAVDGWTHVLQRLKAVEHQQLLAAELELLGGLTRELHTALSCATDDPDFAPEPTTPADLERWQTATDKQSAAALERLAAQLETLAPDAAATARSVLARADDLGARLLAPLAVASAGPRIRHHGDYHLGQVLHTPGGWRIIDFEGEPARALAERRAKHHPLRDVAGMLRSFAYAAAVATRDADASAAATQSPAALTRMMRAAFLRGYDPGLASDAPRTALLALFEAEKLFYELGYELGSRPDWVWIPLAGITDMLV